MGISFLFSFAFSFTSFKRFSFFSFKRYTYLNAEFQIARREKKAFLNDQWKEIEENNRLGKSGGFFKKIRDPSKGTFHAKIGTIKDRNGMYLTEAEDIKKRRQEYTEELY